MRRLKNVYPGDLVKWPNKNGQFDIGAAGEGSKILFYNETPINIDIDFENGSSDVLHAWEANFWILDGDTTQINWQIDADSLNVVNPPINAVFSTIYNPEERLNDKAYPMPLIRQIGGQTTVSNIATNVSNESNAGSTEIVDIGTSSNTKLLDIFNDHFIWSVLQGAAVHQVLKGQTAGNPLQIGQAGDVSEVLGQLTVDQAVTLAAAGLLTHVLGDLTVDGDTKLVTGRLGKAVSADIIDASANDTYIKSRSTGIIHFQVPNGTGVLDLASNGPTLLSGTAYHFLTGSISRQSGNGNIVCGSGTTITHGLGATPALVLATPNIAQAGSATVGIGNVGSTTFQCTVGSGTAVSFWTLAG